MVYSARPPTQPRRDKAIQQIIVQVDELNAQARSLEQADLEQAHALGEKALKLAQAIHYKQGEAFALLNMASSNELRAQYWKSIEEASRVIEMGDTVTPTETIMAEACNLLGWDYYHLGDYPTSMNWATQGLRHAETADDIQKLADAYNLLGTVYGEFPDQTELGIECYQRSLNLYRQLDQTNEVAVLLNNLCISHDSLGHYDEALKYGEEALGYSLETNKPYTETLVLGNLAIVYGKLGQYEKALAYHNRRIQLAAQIGYRTLEVHSILSIGRLYQRWQRYELALEYLHRAVMLAEEHGYRKWLSGAHKDLANLYEEQRDFEKALHHYKQFHAIKSELINEESRTRIELLKISYELESAHLELAKERNQHEQDRAYFERMNALKDNIINTASHDLKNPLSSVFLSFDMLAKMLKNAEPHVKDTIIRGKNSAEQMKHMIYQLLDRAMLESGHGLMFEEVDLSEFLDEILTLFQTLPDDKTLSIVQPAETVIVRIDKERMAQVLNNLFTNAIKYTGKNGRIVCRLSCEQAALHIEVEDNGIGVPQDALPRLFEPFFRVHKHRLIEGTGLGLSIVKTIIDQHGGQIKVTSEENQGTTFQITLPDVVLSVFPT